MKRSLMTVAFSSLVLTACGGNLALIGLDQHGNPVEAFVDEEKYVGHVKEMLESTKQSVGPALNTQSTQGTRWSLSTAIVGFGINGSAGIGPFKMGIKPRFRAVFGKGVNPPIP